MPYHAKSFHVVGYISAALFAFQYGGREKVTISISYVAGSMQTMTVELGSECRWFHCQY